MKKIALLSVVLLLSLYATFALPNVSSAMMPVLRPIEAPSTCAPTGNPNATTIAADCAGEIINPYLTYFDITEGLVVGVALLPVVLFGGKLSKSLPPAVARLLTRRVAFPRPVRYAVLLLSVAGAAGFSVMAAAGLSFFVPSLGPWWVWKITDILSTGTNQNGYIGLGAFLVAALTTLGLTVYRLEHGLVSALGWALSVFTLPAIVVFTAGLYVFAPDQMIFYVTTFSSAWSWNGYWLVTNWFVLIVSSGLFLGLILSSLSKKLSRNV